MPERTFFTLRYALPGYSFILMVVLVAYPELGKKLLLPDVTLPAAFLTFLSVLGGGALGFLVSQIWYAIFNHLIALKHGRIPMIIKKLAEEYNLVDDKSKRIVFQDYVFRLHEKKESKNLIVRYFDLMHLCGSTLVSTVVGAFFGVCVRSYLGGVLFFGLCVRSYAAGILVFVVPKETAIYDSGVFLIVFGLIIFLFLTLKHVIELHSLHLEVAVTEVVNSGRFSPTRAQRVFPSHYFRDQKHTAEQK